MGLVDIVSNIMKSQGGQDNAQPTPEYVTPQPQQAAPMVGQPQVPGMNGAAGYALPYGGMPQATMPMHNQAAAPQGASLQSAGNGIADGSAAANKIMQQNPQGQVAFAAQPQLYHALAQAYRGY